MAYDEYLTTAHKWSIHGNVLAKDQTLLPQQITIEKRRSAHDRYLGNVKAGSPGHDSLAPADLRQLRVTRVQRGMVGPLAAV